MREVLLPGLYLDVRTFRVIGTEVVVLQLPME